MNLDDVFAHLDPQERYVAASVLRQEIRRRRESAEAAREEERSYRRDLVANGPTLIREEKRCPRCGEVKPVTAFGVDRSRPDGRYGFCRACR